MHGTVIFAHPNEINKSSNGGETPLHVSALKGRLEIARALIEANADVNAKKSNGLTPLHLSAREGHLEIAQALIKSGSKFDSFF